MEGRTPYTIHALQDVFACIHTFLGPKLITDVMHKDLGKPVPRQHDNMHASAMSEWFFRVCKNSYSEYENSGSVNAYEVMMEAREAALKEQQER